MRSRRLSRPALYILAIAVLTACASTGRSTPRSSRDVLTRADLEATMQTMAFDAVRQARPQWLRIRGPNSINLDNPIMVYVDGVRAGSVQALEGIPVLTVERMRFYDGSEAQAKFGMNHTNGAIEVITRRGQ